MSLLRIRCPLERAPQHCEWALVDAGREPVAGEGPLAQLPRRAERVELVLPASQVVLMHARLPQAARHRAGSVLGYAIEEQIVGDPHASQVSWLGSEGDEDVLAVIDRERLERWREALRAQGIRIYEMHCETLMLPLHAQAWSLAWDGREGFVRTGRLEGAATDCGDRVSPPLSLRLMLDEARSRGRAPSSLAVYASAEDATVEPEAWQRELGIDVRLAGAWSWRTAGLGAGVALGQDRRRWRPAPGTLARLRPAAWILGAALAVHAVALAIDWSALAREQRALRREMVAQFRASFPEAVAVVDPELQMRRKLAQMRHAAGKPDAGDFLPMIERVAQVTRDLPAGSLRTLSYDSGRVKLELAGLQPAALRGLVARLTGAGMSLVEAPLANRGTVTIQLRAP